MKPNNNHRWNRCRIDEDYSLTFGHGEQFFRAFDKAFNVEMNLVQEKPSDSTSQPAINKADEVCPVECRRTAGIFLASHASARKFTPPNPRCALADSNEEPASVFAPGAASFLIVDSHRIPRTREQPRYNGVLRHEDADSRITNDMVLLLSALSSSL